MSTTSSSRNQKQLLPICESPYKKLMIKSSKCLGKSSSVKLLQRPINKAIMLKVKSKGLTHHSIVKTNRTRNRSNNMIHYESSGIDNLSTTNYIKSTSNKENIFIRTFHIPSFAKIKIRADQMRRLSVTKSVHQLPDCSQNNNNTSLRIKNKNVKSSLELNEEIPAFNVSNLSIIKNKSNQTNENNQQSNNSSIQSQKSSLKKTPYSNKNIRVIEEDEGGPEEFHYMLVDLLRKQKEKMLALSNKLNIKHDGIDVDYLEN